MAKSTQSFRQILLTALKNFKSLPWQCKLDVLIGLIIIDISTSQNYLMEDIKI